MRREELLIQLHKLLNPLLKATGLVNHILRTLYLYVFSLERSRTLWVDQTQ